VGETLHRLLCRIVSSLHTTQDLLGSISLSLFLILPLDPNPVLKAVFTLVKFLIKNVCDFGLGLYQPYFPGNLKQCDTARNGPSCVSSPKGEKDSRGGVIALQNCRYFHQKTLPIYMSLKGEIFEGESREALLKWKDQYG
jgi:hypothetical protein